MSEISSGNFYARAPLAWLALLASTTTLVAGCLDTPPEYSEPTRVPPVIVTGHVDPPPSSLYVAFGPPGSIDFSFPFRADDFGERLQSLVVLDADGNARNLQRADVASDPRTFADQDPPRPFNYTFNWTASDVGCHTLTVILSDSSNIKNFTDISNPLLEARISWFLWLRDPTAPPDTITPDCFPTSGAKQ